MKKLAVSVLIAASVAFSGFSFFIDSKDWQTVADVSYSIGDEAGATCSATRISPTELLTAAHCVDSVQQDKVITIRDGDQKVGTATVAWIGDPDNGPDIAFLRAIFTIDNGKYIAVASTNAYRHEVVVVVGYPQGVAEIVTEGVSQALVTKGNAEYLLHTGPTTYGNSGGGVFVYRMGKWQLVGVTSRFAALQPVFASGLGPIGVVGVNHLIAAVPVSVINQYLNVR